MKISVEECAHVNRPLIRKTGPFFNVSGEVLDVDLCKVIVLKKIPEKKLSRTYKKVIETCSSIIKCILCYYGRLDCWSVWGLTVSERNN